MQIKFYPKFRASCYSSIFDVVFIKEDGEKNDFTVQIWKDGENWDGFEDREETRKEENKTGLLYVIIYYDKDGNEKYEYDISIETAIKRAGEIVGADISENEEIKKFAEYTK